MRKLRSLALICVFGLLLGGCSLFGVSASDIKTLVQGNLDVIYLDQPAAAYLKLVSSTEEEAHQDYEDGVWSEVDFVAECFEIELDVCEDSVSQRLFDLLSTVYDSSKYTVGAAEKTADGYTVEVTIEPIDIFERMLEEDYDAAYEEIWMAYDFSNATEEEYETTWAQFILDLLEARLDKIGYVDPVTVSVHVEKNDEGYYTMNDDDFYKVDWYIIYYGDYPEE